MFVCTVETTTGATTDAIDKSQGQPATGRIGSPGKAAFGREAVVCLAAQASGLTEVLPAAGGQARGLAYNTAARYDSRLHE